MPSFKEKLVQVAILMEPLLEDNAVPRNIRKKINESREKLLSANDNFDVAISTSVYLLEEISNDINMPGHGRTDIYTIISELEKIKEEIKASENGKK